jgi:uncharacterized RDD family membrane protein YckC
MMESGRTSKPERPLAEPTLGPSVSSIPTEREELEQSAAAEHEELTSTFVVKSITGEVLPPAVGQRLLGDAVDLMAIVFFETMLLWATLRTLLRKSIILPVERSTDPNVWLSPSQVPLLAAVIFLYLLLTYLYFGVSYRHFGTSLGKWLVGLRIVDARSGARLTNFWRIFLRETVGKLLSCLPFFLGYAFAYLRRDRQTLHDVLFRTRVEHALPRRR